MRKSKLTDGTPILCVKVEHYVKATNFAHALADHFWCNSIQFNPAITKKEAWEILLNGLFFNGLHGEFRGEQFESADQDVFDEWNIPYEDAMKWVLKNYPYLNI